MSTEKQVYRVFIVYTIIISFLIAIIEIIFKMYNFHYTISFIIGSLISALCFLITIKSVDTVVANPENKVYFYMIGSNMLKILIYSVVLYIVFTSPLNYGIFTCSFGFLTIRISILIRYKFIEPYQDKKRTIDKLYINKEIKNKLKKNNIFKTEQITQLYRRDLKKFLNEKEIKELLYSLKEYELFIKGELEVIKEDDEYDSYEHK